MMNLSKRHKIIVFAIIIAILLGAYIFSVAHKRVEINRQRAEISVLSEKEESIVSDNEVLESTLANGPDEKVKDDIARNDYSMAKPEDRIYYDNTDK